MTRDGSARSVNRQLDTIRHSPLFNNLLLTNERNCVAARLTVVVSQSTNQGSAISDMEETLVAELMLSPGLDATMVGPLERIEADDTDYLCLSSYQYNFALVSTLDAPAVQQAWDRLGLSGTIVDLGLADGANSSSAQSDVVEGKRILYLRLNPNATVGSVVTQLQELLAARNVKPVSIGGLAKTPIPKRQSISEPALADLQQPNSESKLEDGKSVRSGQPEAVPEKAPIVASVEVDSAEVDDDEEWSHLDQLVDDLDDLDL